MMDRFHIIKYTFEKKERRFCFLDRKIDFGNRNVLKTLLRLFM